LNGFALSQCFDIASEIPQINSDQREQESNKQDGAGDLSDSQQQTLDSMQSHIEGSDVLSRSAVHHPKMRQN